MLWTLLHGGAQCLLYVNEHIQLAQLERVQYDALRKLYEENPRFRKRVDHLGHNLALAFHCGSDYFPGGLPGEGQWAEFIRTGKPLRRMAREAREYLEQQILFGGINFDPLFSMYVMNPLVGGIAIALAETCTAPLSRITILSQLLSQPTTIMQQAARILAAEQSQHQMMISGAFQKLKPLWRGQLVSVAHGLTFHGIGFFAYLSYMALLQSGQLMMIGGSSMPASGAAFLCGGLAALTSVSIAYPLDTLRTRIAAQDYRGSSYMGARHVFGNICRNGGFRSLYVGMSASLLGVVPSMAVSAFAYESIRSSWQSIRPNDSTLGVSLACGGLAGLAASTATFPLDVVRIRMQMEDKNRGGGGGGLRAMVGRIVRKEGFRGFYRGIRPHCLKVAPAYAIAFTAYEVMKIPFSASSLIGLPMTPTTTILSSPLIYPGRYFDASHMARGPRNSNQKLPFFHFQLPNPKPC